MRTEDFNKYLLCTYYIIETVLNLHQNATCFNKNHKLFKNAQ